MTVYFVSGVHGVGKTTFCKELSSFSKLPHFSAGHLINDFLEKRAENKIVQNPNENQDILIQSISALDIEGDFILDGHFVLVTEQGFQTIDIKVFQDLKIAGIILLHEEPSIIQERLNSRDKKEYSLPHIEEFQNLEIQRAQEVSKELNVPFLKLRSMESAQLKNLSLIKQEVLRK